MTKLSFPEFAQAERLRLTDAGIPFQLLDKKTDTILIDSQHLQSMLELLGAEAVQADTASKYEGIVAMRLSEKIRVPDLAPRRAPITDNNERARYIKVCAKRIEKLTKQAEKAADKLRKKFFAATTGMFTVWRKEAFYVEANAVAERRDRLIAEFESLKAAPHVESVRVVGNTVIVRTDLLTASDPKTNYDHEIGRFTILIDLNGKNGVVRWFNRDKRVDGFKAGMNAPNVLADGTACLCETLQPMAELTARLELAVVVDLAIQHIENAGSNELGAYINLWPRRW